MKLGVIGGSGLYDLEGIEDFEHRKIETPFGAPSDAFVCGKIAGAEVFFVPRHGKGHRLLPSEINYKANICGLKMLGVDRIISVSAVGSLKEDMRPRDIVLPDQYYDRTKSYERHTFFGDGVVAHVAFGDPTCPELRNVIGDATEAFLAGDNNPDGVRLFRSGTYVNMEGPAFSTRAESNIYRQLDCDIIGMTSLAEAKLCREAEICYQAMAMVTDYDCWRESEEAVNVDMVMAVVAANTKLAKVLLGKLIPKLSEERTCSCGSALANALLTDGKVIPEETKERLQLIIGKYVK